MLRELDVFIVADFIDPDPFDPFQMTLTPFTVADFIDPDPFDRLIDPDPFP